MANLQLPEQTQTHMPISLVDARLRGIEDELRLLRGLVERLVRVEERMANSQRQTDALQVELATLRGRLDATASAGQRSAWSIDRFERLGWIVVAAVAAWIGQGLGG